MLAQGLQMFLETQQGENVERCDARASPIDKGAIQAWSSSCLARLIGLARPPAGRLRLTGAPRPFADERTLAQDYCHP